MSQPVVVSKQGWGPVVSLERPEARMRKERTAVEDALRIREMCRAEAELRGLPRGSSAGASD